MAWMLALILQLNQTLQPLPLASPLGFAINCSFQESPSPPSNAFWPDATSHLRVEIIVSSHAVSKITQKYQIPFSKFHPMAISCITIIQYHNQEINIDAIHWSNSDSSFTCTQLCLYVFVTLYNCTTCEDGYGHHKSQDTEQFHLKDSWGYPS